MSLPHAILTALLEKPSSGLELTRRFDKSIGYFWSATHQQIYRELGRLEGEGHIRALPAEQPARGQKKRYEVLPAGRAELARWTAAAQDPKPQRDVLLLRLRAAAVVGTEGLEADLRRHLELHRRQLSEYEEIERRDFPPGRDAPQDRLRHLVLRAGIDLETFWTRWLTHALEEFAELPGAAPEAQPREPAPDTSG
ncbi:PadR family transcriptional regulator [Streptomyces bungoensis]|uniref:PadR family transcriptional regulator n=1 Tax=Streptomyces bungoensis TaxID=285568 RepID=A0A101TCA4_9ACTN|nr:PadR family transcriptional regulator [Streptomyces bungoensis]KUN89515.1 PadR family transcriptional regulator [Streptomyces bungoensis]